MCKSKTECNKLYLYDNEATATIEFSMVFPIIVLLGLMLIDFTFHFSTESKLARLSNSMSSVIRERSILYANSDAIKLEDVADIQKVVDILLSSDTLKGSVSVRVQAIFFSDTSSKYNKIIDSGKTLDIYVPSSINPVDKDKCGGHYNITSTTVLNMSPWMKTSDSEGKWAPLYQLTLCTKGRDSLFKNALAGVGVIADTLSTSNIVIPR